GAMVGLGAADPAAAALVSGVLRAPYYLATLGAAAAITWLAPQTTFDFTERLTPARAALALSLLGLSLAVMETQGHNPFIYFIF
ncbi:MAG: hypothetical protein AAFY88_01520, partial [Acidobacteriota bacterium]